MRIHGMGPRVCFNAEGGAGGAAAGAGAGAAGNPGGGTNGASPGNGSADNKGTPSWLDGLSAENRQLSTNKGWADPNKGFDSYRELEAKIGKAILLPDANAEADQWEGFYDKLGRPKIPTEYKIERPKGLPADAPYDAVAAENMKTLFHKAGLTPRQAAVLHDAVFEGQHKVATEEAAKEAEAVGKAHDLLVKAWGEPESAEYMRNVELSNRAIRQFGGDEMMAELKAIGAFTKDGSVKSPLLAQMFAKIGQQNFAEDALWGGAGDYKNPFADKTVNLEEQGKIITTDPDRARQLIRAAGFDPVEWQL